ncbi:MAG: hypothetical protein GC147_14780 [Porphyrobacter sp.]|nr:hypothetical protein [Porphyrobacter sp.]
MENHKLDMGKAWTQTTALIGANRDLLSVMAGLFFFLPSFAAALFLPEMATNAEIGAVRSAGAVDEQAQVQALMDQFAAMYAANWPTLLLVTVAGFVGSMSLLALLTDRGNPTVGEALGTGLRSIPSYIAAQILSTLAAGIALGVPFAIVAAAAPAGVAVAFALLLVVAMIYLVIKFSLIAPVIAIDGERNPITAIARSWRLTKGNSFRIFAFFMLLFIVTVIIGSLVQGILTLIFAAVGGEVARIGTAAVSALVNAVLTVIFLVVIAAVHRQLAGASPERLAETFE